MLAGRGPPGLIASWIIKGAKYSSACVANICDVLVPQIESGPVLILNTLATHRKKNVVAILRDHGCRFLILPSYSPNLNPIDMAFSKFKAHQRCFGAANLGTRCRTLTILRPRP